MNYKLLGLRVILQRAILVLIAVLVPSLLPALFFDNWPEDAPLIIRMMIWYVICFFLVTLLFVVRHLVIELLPALEVIGRKYHEKGDWL